jgi:hypothetical protein
LPFEDVYDVISGYKFNFFNYFIRDACFELQYALKNEENKIAALKKIFQ